MWFFFNFLYGTKKFSMVLFVYPSAVMQPEYATAKQYIIGGLYDHVSTYPAVTASSEMD